MLCGVFLLKLSHSERKEALMNQMSHLKVCVSTMLAVFLTCIECFTYQGYIYNVK